jgi:3-methylfumaryl-CoA hydratase
VGEPLPPLWHWLALPQWSPSSMLGGDGHPRRGSFLPPVELPRRMFAGGEVSLHAPIAIGSTVRREAEVSGVERKHGRSGELVIVTTRTRLYDGHTLCLEERQDLIYRDAARRQPSPADAVLPASVDPGAPLRALGERTWALHTDPSLLMRFSAATANAHRIHYDWPYATGVERYPGLVVHGPLITLLLAETARLAGLDHVQRLSHRNLAPLFCGEPAHLTLSPDPDRADAHLATLTSGTTAGAQTLHTSLTLTRKALS